MITLRQCIIVEGKYDKQKLERLVDAVILTTDGFRIFRDREKRELIRRLAQTNGLLILTDSDKAGFLIRSHIKGLVPPERITNVYIPALRGKERRKPEPSKEGLLGVEGMTDEILLDALARAGVLSEEVRPLAGLTKADFYRDGLSGRPDSAKLRQKLLAKLNLPHYITANALLSLINATMTAEEYHAAVAAILSEPIE